MLFSTDMNQLALVSRAAAAFLREHDLAALACGRHELGRDDYVNVMAYAPKDRADASFESHRDYVDIQVELDGAEYLEVAPRDGLTVTSAYDAAGDFSLYDGSTAGERFLMTPGRFCLVMPEDAHMPGVRVRETPPTVKKAVFKVRVEHLEQL